MKDEQQIKNEAERLFKVFMDPSTKKPLRDQSYIEYHKLVWVITDEQSIIDKRLDEIAIGRNKTSKSK